MSIDQKYGRYCDECGRNIHKAHRIFQEKDYCSSCYPRVFVSMPCTLCGASARTHHLSQEPATCRSCTKIGRACVRCEKPIVKAGMISEGKPVCPSCVPHFRTPNPCAACGKLSSRLSAIPSLDIREKICNSCRNKLTHRTCTICKKYRKVAGVTADDKPHCDACYPNKQITHSCPTCSMTLPGSGKGKCRSCLNLSQLKKEANFLAAAMVHTWMKNHCISFAQWLWQRRPDSPQLIGIYRSHQSMMERVDASFLNEHDISTTALLNVFGAATLRRHLLVTQYFQNALDLRISVIEKSEAADIERIRAKLLESKRSSWHTVMHEYAAWLENEGILVRTQRMYISTADTFCRFVSLTDAPWRAEQANNFARRYPSSRTNLSKFIGYCKRVRNWDVGMPKFEGNQTRRTRIPNTIPYLKKLLHKVNEVGIHAVDQGTLCRIIAKSLGLTIATIKSVSAKQFINNAGALTLFLEYESIIIPKELEDITDAYIEYLNKSPSAST